MQVILGRTVEHSADVFGDELMTLVDEQDMWTRLVRHPPSKRRLGEFVDEQLAQKNGLPVGKIAARLEVAQQGLALIHDPLGIKAVLLLAEDALHHRTACDAED